MKGERGLRSSLNLVLTALCAALYAVGAYTTAYIPTPWLVQLRPAVVIPAAFAVLFGPLVGGLGAAIGTFIASIFTYGTAVLTIFSGTPGNFVCFYVMGKLCKPFTWRNFMAATLLGFLAGSLIIGFGLWLLLANFNFLIPAGTYAYEAMKGSMAAIAKDPAAWILGTIVWTLGTGAICTVLIGVPVLRVCQKAFPQLFK
ncbi:MAG: ECF transporter S component [Candidatus Bathyarchaeia archaeon]